MIVPDNVDVGTEHHDFCVVTTQDRVAWDKTSHQRKAFQRESEKSGVRTPA